MVLVQNWPFFNLFFSQYRPGKCVLRYSRTKQKSVLGYKNSQLKKWKNCDFCKGVNPWFWSKIGHFSIFLFLSVIGQENVFYDILEWKNAFLNYKNSIFKKWKNCDFCKGVNPWFWSKIGHFSIFCF